MPGDHAFVYADGDSLLLSAVGSGRPREIHAASGEIVTASLSGDGPAPSAPPTEWLGPDPNSARAPMSVAAALIHPRSRSRCRRAARRRSGH